MYQVDWKKLHTRFGVTYNGHESLLEDKNQTVKLIFTGGRRKDIVATLIGFEANKAIVRMPDGTIQKPTYASVSLMDAYGEATTKSGPRDMIGEPFVENAWVAYSRKTGKQGHAFCLGRILEISKSGMLTVKEVLCDGEQVRPDRWNTHVRKVKQVRALKLPSDPTRLSMAIFSDFASADGSHD
jgi:hypothetical protein